MLDDEQTNYLFQCGNEELFAVSLDKTGKNIPRSSCVQGWQLLKQLQLGMQDPRAATINPGPVQRGITDKGYYVWRAGRISA